MILRYNPYTIGVDGQLYSFSVDPYRGEDLVVYTKPRTHLASDGYVDQTWCRIYLEVKGTDDDATRLAERFWELVRAGETCIDLHALAKEVVQAWEPLEV